MVSLDRENEFERVGTDGAALLLLRNPALLARPEKGFEGFVGVLDRGCWTASLLSSMMQLLSACVRDRDMLPLTSLHEEVVATAAAA